MSRSFKAFATRSLIGAVVAVGAWYLASFVFFGQASFPFLVLMLVVPMIGTLIASATVNEDLAGPHVLAMLSVAALGVVLMLSSPFVATMSANKASDKLALAAEMMGRTPTVLAALGPALTDRKEAAKHAELIEQIARGSVYREDVSAYIAAARQLDVDPRFVAENGVIRRQDRDELYRKALDLAREGNSDALAFVASSAASRL